MASPSATARRTVLLAVLLAGPAIAQPADMRRARIVDALDSARSFLCDDCENDIEAEGVNRPMRRVVLASAALANAEALMQEALDEGRGGYGPAMVQLLSALTSLESLDEAAALAALRAAQGALP
jgi:hypothetical protein